jgi:hypothetical protein
MYVRGTGGGIRADYGGEPNRSIIERYGSRFMSTPSVASLRTLARRLRKPPAPILIIAVVVMLVAGGTAIALLHRSAPAGPARKQTADAQPGPRPVSRPLPAGTSANHGYAKGSRPPVVPPGLKAAAAPRHLTAQVGRRAEAGRPRDRGRHEG